MTKLSIKKKLLIYTFFIQFSVLILFSFSLYHALAISATDKLQSTLKIIVLDITNDFLENPSKMIKTKFDEGKKYKFEPLYIRLITVDDSVHVLNSTLFPPMLSSPLSTLIQLEKDTLVFQENEAYLICRTKILLDNKTYIIEVATDNSFLDATLKNLLYIFLFIIPIIMIFATIGGYFLIYKSFLPIEEILKNLKNIYAKDLSQRLIAANKSDEIGQLTSEINNLLTRLEVSFEKISQFSSDASHEFKTPLTIIRGEIEVGLRRDRTSNEYKEILTHTLDEVLLIQQTVDDLLFLSKSEQQAKPAPKEEVYLDEITLQAIKELSPFATLKSVHVTCKIENAMQIKGYSKLLKIAIKNILKNAISFSHDGADVIVSNYEKDGFFIICIEDFGIGIDEKEHKKVFEKFYRTDHSRDKNSGGTGLGMAISQKIVTMHHGSLTLKSEIHKGTIVTIRFSSHQKSSPILI